MIWQWGRFGAGPRVAAELADGLRLAGAASVVLSLAERAEILQAGPPHLRCELSMPTYRTRIGFAARLASGPLGRLGLADRIAAWRPDIAICAMPGMLDGSMTACLRRLRIPFAAVIHDAELHPGDGLPLQMWMQRRLIRRADALIALSDHVASQLAADPISVDKPLLAARLPPFAFGPTPPPSGAHGGRLRLLFFGRLLPYKGLDLLADALRRFCGIDRIELRVVGEGPESPVLDALRALPNVTVENRWVPEHEIGALLAWSDALVLCYREASQSGVAAAAISARRWVVSTAVGGLVEQFRDEPLALLCRPDAADIALTLQRLVDNPPGGDAADAGADHSAKWRDVSASLLRQLEDRFGTFLDPFLPQPGSPGPDRAAGTGPAGPSTTSAP